MRISHMQHCAIQHVSLGVTDENCFADLCYTAIAHKGEGQGARLKAGRRFHCDIFAFSHRAKFAKMAANDRPNVRIT
jgi:hypothetical protein